MTDPVPSERLLARLRQEGIIPAATAAAMTNRYRSSSRREAGQWSWYATWTDPADGETARAAGSRRTMGEVLSWPAWQLTTDEAGDISITQGTPPIDSGH
jgi:hypothetical protein